MSYILDALRRADSERERGVVPGIHAQPVPPHWRDARGGQRTMKPWVGAVIGLSVVVLGAFAWHLLGSEAPPAVAPSAAPPTPSPATASPPAAAPATLAIPAPPATAAQNPPAASPAAPPAVAAATPAPAKKSAERPRAAASPSAEPARRKPAAPPTVAEQNPARAATNDATPGSEARVHALSELPQEIRRQLPSLTIGGSMYSETASSRMLIVNGQLLHEGDALTPELSLERIKLKSAILKFKGYRYEITY